MIAGVQVEGVSQLPPEVERGRPAAVGKTDPDKNSLGLRLLVLTHSAKGPLTEHHLPQTGHALPQGCCWRQSRRTAPEATPYLMSGHYHPHQSAEQQLLTLG